MDATRISDDRLVFIKQIATDSDEARIARMLSSEELQGYVDNHCVPILDFLPDNEDPSISYLIMPFLRRVDSPPFQLVNDIIEVVDQLLRVRKRSLICRPCMMLT